jgi:hypothetical protein
VVYARGAPSRTRARALSILHGLGGLEVPGFDRDDNDGQRFSDGSYNRPGPALGRLPLPNGGAQLDASGSSESPARDQEATTVDDDDDQEKNERYGDGSR